MAETNDRNNYKQSMQHGMRITKASIVATITPELSTYNRATHKQASEQHHTEREGTVHSSSCTSFCTVERSL